MSSALVTVAAVSGSFAVAGGLTLLIVWVTGWIVRGGLHGLAEFLLNHRRDRSTGNG